MIWTIIYIFIAIFLIWFLLSLLLPLLKQAVYDNKCPHWKYCEWYDDGSVCNETGGYYYYDRVAGCVDTWNQRIRDREAGLEWEEKREAKKQERKSKKGGK